MLDLYKNIRNKRQELGLTQTELAHKLGYSDKSMIAKIEGGKVDLSQSKILAFADVLHTSASTLMGWEDEETNIVPLHPDNKEAEEKPSARQVMIATIDKLSDSEKAHWTALMHEYLQSKQGNH
jgi:transcriptional regulator with XRE-family HTH domain